MGKAGDKAAGDGLIRLGKVGEKATGDGLSRLGKAGEKATGDGLTRLGKAGEKAAGNGFTWLRKTEPKVLSGSIKVCRGDVQVAKGRSGARTPGIPASGAQQRFHKLKLPKKVVKTLPMGATVSPTLLGSPEEGVEMCHFRGS